MVERQLSSNLLQESCREILQTINILQNYEDESALEHIEPEVMSLLFDQAGGQILVKIRKNSWRGTMNLQELCQKLDVNYTTTTNNVKSLKEEGLVKTKEKGRTKEADLTNKGAQVAEKLTEINELVR